MNLILKLPVQASQGLSRLVRQLRNVQLQRFSSFIRKYPIVIEDSYGIRTIHYPWDSRPIDKIVSRTFYRSEFNGIAKLVTQGSIVFDIGANIGLHSVFLSRIIGLTGTLYAFEPVPSTYWLLKETITLNRCENVVALQLAICDINGIATMNIFDLEHSDYNTMGNPVMPGMDGQLIRPLKTIQVTSETLDTFCTRKNVEKIDFLKVDVEGFEKSVFVGSENLLKTQRVKFLSFEISQDPLRGAGFRAHEVFDILRSYGYHSYCFDDSTNTFIGPIHNSEEYYEVYFASPFPLSSLKPTDTSKFFEL